LTIIRIFIALKFVKYLICSSGYVLETQNGIENEMKKERNRWYAHHEVQILSNNTHLDS